MNNSQNVHTGHWEEGMVNIKPSFKARTPYIFHFDEQTVVLGSTTCNNLSRVRHLVVHDA